MSTSRICVNSFFNMHAQLFGGSKGLNLDQGLYLCLNLACANSAQVRLSILTVYSLYWLKSLKQFFINVLNRAIRVRLATRI